MNPSEDEMGRMAQEQVEQARKSVARAIRRVAGGPRPLSSAVPAETLQLLHADGLIHVESSRSLSK